MSPTVARARVLSAAVLIACVLGFGSSVARADDLGGLASIRAWASAPPLHDPITIRRTAPNKPIVLPGNRVFRYFDAGAGPLTGRYARYGRWAWTARGLHGLGADAWSIATSTPSNELTVRVSGGARYAFRFRVNGSASAVKYLPNRHWQDRDITIRFPDARRRTVILQMTGYGSDFNGAVKPTTGHLAPPQLRLGPRTIFLGDSWTAGIPLAAPFEGYVQTTADLLGLGDAWASGIGGAGYVNPGAAKVTWGERLQSDVLRWHPANVIVAGGTNDFAEPLSAFKTAVTQFFVRARRALPHAKLIAVGPWKYTGMVWSGYAAYADVIRAAVTAVGGLFIDPEDWITGTGSTLKPAHDGGNADIFIGAENHPNLVGYRYIGTRLARELQALPPNAGR
jgi:hypothetical protein